MGYLWTAVSWSAAWDSSTAWSLPSGESRFGASAILVLLCYCLRISPLFWSRLKWQLFSYTQQLLSGLPRDFILILGLIVSRGCIVLTNALTFPLALHSSWNAWTIKGWSSVQIFKVCREWILLPWSAADFSSNTTLRVIYSLWSASLSIGWTVIISCTVIHVSLLMSCNCFSALVPKLLILFHHQVYSL